MTEKPKNVRTKTADWSPDRKFKHYWSLRMNHLKKALQGVGNLSNPNIYEYSEEERSKTIKLVKEWTKEYFEMKWQKAKEQKEKRNKSSDTSFYEQYFPKK